jgi:uncharacterized protein (TIGR02680 family)
VDATGSFDDTPMRHHPWRWRLSRAGFVNVWHYYDNTFDLSGGRLILRGTNGSGKSRALEMLLPYLLDADRRNMGTGSAVRMEDLMSAGSEGQGNRLGYMWLELRRDPGSNHPGDDDDPGSGDDPGGDDDPGGGEPEFLTLGALVRFAVSTKDAKVWYFSTPLRVGHGLGLLGPDRLPLSRAELTAHIGPDRITDVPDKHRERVRTEVFGLIGDLGKDRFDGLVKLLHTLRSPDVGNRIEEGKLPAILSDALPPLSEDALANAGQQLDGLTETRFAQERLEAARGHVTEFLGVYRRYVTGVLIGSLERARAGARSVDGAGQAAARCAEVARDLDGQVTATALRHGELAGRITQLDAALTGLKESPAYRGARELTERAEIVASLVRSADSALASAARLRDAERGKVADADALIGEVEQAAGSLTRAVRSAWEQLAEAGLTGHHLPIAVTAHRAAVPGTVDVLCTARGDDPTAVTRPRADTVIVTPPDLPGLADTAEAVRRAASARSTQAGNRAADAAALREEQARVTVDTERADDADGRARDDAEIAGAARETRDDAAIALVDGWRAWLADPATQDLLGVADWSEQPSLAALLADRTALCGEVGAVALPDLDRAPDDAVASARDALTSAIARLTGAEEAVAGQVADLEREQRRLRAEHDPEPRPPFRTRPGPGVALWRCLDFREGVTAGDRAGIEAALLAAGMLTATVGADGGLAAADGQLKLSASTAPVEHAVTAVLVPDPAGDVPAAAVTAILERIGYRDRSALTWIDADGSWRNGPLEGRHTVAAARHIGAAARAAARALRLDEIAADLARLADEARARDAERDRLRTRQRMLRDHRRTAPTSTGLATARNRAEDAARRADRAAGQATQARERADALRRAFADHDRAHRAACAQFGLPTGIEELARMQRAAADAASLCVTIVEEVGTLTGRLERHALAVAAVGAVAQPRAAAEAAAAGEVEEWQAQATRLESLTRAVGAAANDIQRQVADTEGELRKARAEERDAATHLNRLTRDSGTATAEAATAATQVQREQDALSDHVRRALDQLAQPGVAETAFTADPGPVFTDPAPAAVERDAATLLAALRPDRRDENTLLRAQQAFERDMLASYDLVATIVAGIRLFDLADATGRRPLAQAAADIARQCEQGRGALTQREQKVFTDFVLGEVGEELRRRLAQADTLISAMNASLASIRTSHGIGVRLIWKLSEDVSGDVSRIKNLVATAASVRTAAQDAELITLLSARVAAEAVKDPTSGYASHVRNALDYRSWHTVEVVITGPEEGRERRISRRAKLSQGETRFVSYVTLFAAADAYLTGLEGTGRALRLILLDDAFAKVDEPTIAELLGLLVRLDVDFAMTGHALWGCVPQVPALDVYEICRDDDGPAATAHVHWDGRNRHFLRVT